MKVKDLIKALKGCKQDREIYVACDEELNTIFSSFEIGEIDAGKPESVQPSYYCLYGLSGSEME